SGNTNPTASTSNPPADQIKTLTVETPIPTVSSPVPTAYSTDSQEPSSDARLISERVAYQEETPYMENIISLTNRFEDISGVSSNLEESNGVEVDLSNMETVITSSPTPTLRIHKDHPKSQIIGLMDSPIQTRNKSKEVKEQSFIATIHQKTDPALLQFCLFSCFLSQVEPKKISDALQDLSWVEAMQEEPFKFKIQNVWTLVDCPKGKEGIDYDEVFSHVARIEAIRLFLAYASFMGFTVYQMDVKSAFLYGTIDEEVIFRYLKGHPKLGLWYPKESPFDLVAYSDSDYGGATQDRKSTTRGCQFLGRRLISWQCKKQTIVATSTTEAEYVAAASCCGQVLWIQNQLLDYGNTIMARLQFCDYHNMVSILEKSEHNADFHPTVDFIEASPLRYALTVKPTVYVSHIRQFWSTARIETTDKGTQILATVDGIHRTVSKSSLRRNLKLQDEEGINEHASPLRDVSQREACPSDSGFIADQDRATIDKSSTLPHDSAPRVTSPVADEGSMQQTILELLALCTSLQRQLSELTAKFQAQEGRSMDEEEAATERISDDSKDMATVLTSIDAATVLASGVVDVPTGSGSIPTASTPAKEQVPTGSDVVSTASPVFATATVVTPYRRRKGKEVMVESETSKKHKVQEQIDAQVAREMEEQLEREDQRRSEQIARDAEIARIHAKEELQIMIDGLDRNNETVAKYLQEYHQFTSELLTERRIELITDLVKYQDNYAKIYKYQSQQRKSMTNKQKRDYYMAVIRNNLGWKVKDFRGMTFEEVEAKFNSVWKQMEDFIPMGSKEEAERIKRKGLNLEQESVEKQKTSEEVPKEAMSPEEVPEEKVKEMMHLVPIEEVYVEALQVKHHIIDWKDKEIFMLVEKDYPLRKRLALVMISYKLQVENYSQMANDLILKIHKIANSLRQQVTLVEEQMSPWKGNLPRLKERVKLLEDRDGVAAQRSGDDAPIKGRSLDKGEKKKRQRSHGGVKNSKETESSRADSCPGCQRAGRATRERIREGSLSQPSMLLELAGNCFFLGLGISGSGGGVVQKWGRGKKFGGFSTIGPWGWQGLTLYQGAMNWSDGFRWELHSGIGGIISGQGNDTLYERRHIPKNRGCCTWFKFVRWIKESMKDRRWSCDWVKIPRAIASEKHPKSHETCTNTNKTYCSHSKHEQTWETSKKEDAVWFHSKRIEKREREARMDEIISQQWDTFRGKFDKAVKWFYKSYLENPLPGPIPLRINGVQIHLFDLYKLIEGLGGYLSVYFRNEFGTIGEILGLSKKDGEEVKKCYIKYLDVFTSYYKTARVPNQEYRSNPDMPTKIVKEGKEYTCLASHQCDFAEIKAPNMEASNRKGKKKIDHFGVKLEDLNEKEYNNS
nr:bulb-type lectin domain-containing protein [Tanacetum cinerariifolium]